MGPSLDIYSEPEFDANTLANLGPLRPMAGLFIAHEGEDVHPFEGGNERDAYRDEIVLTPIDPQTNGPQLLYGLRYLQHVRRHGEIEMFHDQVGYWIWEPAINQVTLTLSIPRAQAALAIGTCAPDATSFTVRAQRGSTTNGIVSGAFLDEHFTTVSFEMTVTVIDENSWRYEQDTVLEITGRSQLVHHRDIATLVRVSPAPLNPSAQLP
jgi:hypothetical protein